MYPPPSGGSGPALWYKTELLDLIIRSPPTPIKNYEGYPYNNFDLWVCRYFNQDFIEHNNWTFLPNLPEVQRHLRQPLESWWRSRLRCLEVCPTLLNRFLVKKMLSETFKIDLSWTTQKVTITKENIIDKQGIGQLNFVSLLINCCAVEISFPSPILKLLLKIYIAQHWQIKKHFMLL